MHTLDGCAAAVSDQSAGDHGRVWDGFAGSFVAADAAVTEPAIATDADPLETSAAAASPDPTPAAPTADVLVEPAEKRPQNLAIGKMCTLDKQASSDPTNDQDSPK